MVSAPPEEEERGWSFVPGHRWGLLGAVPMERLVPVPGQVVTPGDTSLA